MTDHASPCQALTEVQGRMNAESAWREAHEQQHSEEREARRRTDERIFTRLDEAFHEAMARPAVWVTAGFTGLGTIIGILMGVIGMLLRVGK